jgi:hypothetical protein
MAILNITGNGQTSSCDGEELAETETTPVLLDNFEMGSNTYSRLVFIGPADNGSDNEAWLQSHPSEDWLQSPAPIY